MTLRPVALALTALGLLVSTQAFAAIRVYAANVYLDRNEPGAFLFVDDITFGDEMDPEGARQIVLTGDKLGRLRIGFERIRRIEMLRWLGLEDDRAQYQVRVTYRDGPTVVGRLELRKLAGRVDRQPWFQLLATRDDRGERLLKIEFLEP